MILKSGVTSFPLKEKVLLVIVVSVSGAPVCPLSNDTLVPSGKPLISPVILNPSTALAGGTTTFAGEGDFLVIGF